MLTVCIFSGIQAQTGNTTTGFSVGTSGSFNSFFGYYAGTSSIPETTGNSFFGAYCGRFITTGYSNTASGGFSLYRNTTGFENTSYGFSSLFGNITGTNNTAIGFQSLNSNSTGNNNVSVGSNALFNNTTGTANTAQGNLALHSNTTGSWNTASGSIALLFNTSGDYNSAYGTASLHYNTTGKNNTSVGVTSLYRNTEGTHNTAVGMSALINNYTGNYNTAVGLSSLMDNRTGSYNSALGYKAGPNSESFINTTALGAGTKVTASNQIRIGNSDVSSIGGQVSWSTISDGRFKTDIKDDVAGLAFINQLKPVSYTIDRDALYHFLNPEGAEQSDIKHDTEIRQTGFIAQEVEKIVQNTDAVFYGVDAPQNDRDHYSIRYADFVVPLVKAVQELSAQLEEQQKKIDLLLTQIKNEQSINDERPAVTDGMLYQNVPNPFVRETEINIALPKTAKKASIVIYNMEGTELSTIPIDDLAQTSIKISNNDLKPGMYWYALLVDGNVVDTKRMILTKY